MNRNFICLSLLFVIFSFFSCSTAKKIDALKPEPNYPTSVVYEKEVSYVHVPVDITVEDVQRLINKSVNGLIYEDNSLDGDNLAMKVWKQAPIVVGEQGGKLTIELPLKAWVKVRYGVEKFGLSAFDTRELNLNGRIKATTAASFQNWKFSTATQINSIDWTEAPTISIAGKEIPITLLIKPAVAVFKSKMAKLADDAIANSVDIKPYVLSGLEQISHPIEVNKDYHISIAVQPLELYSTKAVVANKKISLSMGMKAYMETAVNGKPTLSFDKNKLMLLSTDNLPADFNLNVATIVTYSNAAALMQANFAGKTFESGGRSVKINKVDVWGKDGKMIVQLNMSGSVNGDFYLSGIPTYDTAKKEIFVDKTEFVLDSKNKLLKLGDWLAHGLILKKLENSCRFSIAEQLKQGETTAKGFLNNSQQIKGIQLSGTLTELTPKNIILTPNAIVAMIIAKGKAGLSINGLP